jgi:hypothetical protein
MFEKLMALYNAALGESHVAGLKAVWDAAQAEALAEVTEVKEEIASVVHSAEEALGFGQEPTTTEGSAGLKYLPQSDVAAQSEVPAPTQPVASEQNVSAPSLNAPIEPLSQPETSVSPVNHVYNTGD